MVNGEQVNYVVIVPAALMIEAFMTMMLTLFENKAILSVLKNFTILAPLFLANIGKPQRMAVEMTFNGDMRISGDECQPAQHGKLYCSSTATSLSGAIRIPHRLTVILKRTWRFPELDVIQQVFKDVHAPGACAQLALMVSYSHV